MHLEAVVTIETARPLDRLRRSDGRLGRSPFPEKSDGARGDGGRYFDLRHEGPHRKKRITLGSTLQFFHCNSVYRGFDNRSEEMAGADSCVLVQTLCNGRPLRRCRFWPSAIVFLRLVHLRVKVGLQARLLLGWLQILTPCNGVSGRRAGDGRGAGADSNPSRRCRF